MPDLMDSGEVPAFALYLASIWTLFGRTLLVSHLAMLPFVVGILFQLASLCRKLIPQEYFSYAFLLILLDPTLLSQITLVSPDLPLLFFFLLACNAVLSNNKLSLIISVTFLLNMITRGILLSFCILLFDMYYNISFSKKVKVTLNEILTRLLLYFPGLLILVIYNWYHYHSKGWILSFEDSPWAGTKEIVDIRGLILNVVYLIWRLIDFGKVIVYAIILFLVIRLKNKIFNRRESVILFVLATLILVFSHLDMLWAKNLLSHRYFMPLNICVSLLCSSVLFSILIGRKTRVTLLILWIGFLISGNFWIYPDKIAKGWDSTLAHLPYCDLRLQAIGYLEKNNIDFEEVQSFFPNVATIDAIDLNGDHRNFGNFDGSSRFVFYSNIFNISDQEYDQLQNSKYYKNIKRFEKNGVYVSIFEKQL